MLLTSFGFGIDDRKAWMSSRSPFGSTFSLYGGMPVLLVRINAEKPSHGSGSGASTLPLLVATDPCPSKPWHCQQPYFTKAALPLAAPPAASAEPWPIAPTASAASARRNI